MIIEKSKFVERIFGVYRRKEKGKYRGAMAKVSSR